MFAVVASRRAFRLAAIVYLNYVLPQMASSSHSGGDEERDLRRQLARMTRLNENLNARLERETIRMVKDASAYEAKIAELQEDIDSAARERSTPSSQVEDILHTANEHRDARALAEAKLAAVELKLTELTTNMQRVAQEMAQKRIAEAMGEAARKCEAQIIAAHVQVRLYPNLITLR